MSLRRRNFLALLVLVSLLFTSVTPAFAQDVTPDVPDQANRIFFALNCFRQRDVVLQSPTPTGPLAPGEAPVADSTRAASNRALPPARRLPRAVPRQASSWCSMKALIPRLLLRLAVDRSFTATPRSSTASRWCSRPTTSSTWLAPRASGRLSRRTGSADTCDASPAFIGAPAAWGAFAGRAVQVKAWSSASSTLASGPSTPRFPDPDPAGKPYAPGRRAWFERFCGRRATQHL